jgi:hypothetical protein
MPPLPDRIADIAVPQDDLSAAAWRWADRTLPAYLLRHSVRSYCWGAVIGKDEGWSFDRRLLWVASLMHDVGLTRIPSNTTCFEVEGGRIARRFVERRGLSVAEAGIVERAIVLHMQPSVSLDDGVEAVLLDRATGLDVRGVGFALVDRVRQPVVRDFPRGGFDRSFLAAITREATIRPTCQSARLLHVTGLAAAQAASPWAGP